MSSLGEKSGAGPEASFSSARYWEERYRRGGHSGFGSRGDLASFKAEVLNSFVKRHGVRHVMDLGCGDGNQLSLSDYPAYTGIDVSKTVLDMVQKKFEHDPSKQFFLYRPGDLVACGAHFKFDLSISLDVIYHLSEDDVFDVYMQDLFCSSSRYVIIYSSNHDEPSGADYLRHRKFMEWIGQRCPSFCWTGFLKNKYPVSRYPYPDGSFSDFYFFEKIG